MSSVIDLVKNKDTDAKHWAEEFMSTIDGMTKNEIDEDLMTSWFASSIETAKDSCWPGACAVCKHIVESEMMEDLSCSLNGSMKVYPFFYCAEYTRM